MKCAYDDVSDGRNLFLLRGKGADKSHSKFSYKENINMTSLIAGKYLEIQSELRNDIK